MAEEFGITWCVEEVDAGGFTAILCFEARHRELEGVLHLLFEGAVIANCTAPFYASGRGYRARLCEQRLGQSSLATARLTDERDRPHVFDIRHGSLPPRFLSYTTKVARREGETEQLADSSLHANLKTVLKT